MYNFIRIYIIPSVLVFIKYLLKYFGLLFNQNKLWNEIYFFQIFRSRAWLNFSRYNKNKTISQDMAINATNHIKILFFSIKSQILFLLYNTFKNIFFSLKSVNVVQW